MTLYYLVTQFGGQYLLGLVIVAMTLRCVNAISDTNFRVWQILLITVLWPLLLPVVFVASICMKNLRHCWERFKFKRSRAENCSKEA